MVSGTYSTLLLRSMAMATESVALCGVAPERRFDAEQPRLNQRLTYPRNLRIPDLDQGRTHHRARQSAEQHQRFLHAVMHVDKRIGVEHLRQRMDPVVEAAGLREIVVLHGAK